MAHTRFVFALAFVLVGMQVRVFADDFQPPRASPRSVRLTDGPEPIRFAPPPPVTRIDGNGRIRIFSDQREADRVLGQEAENTDRSANKVRSLDEHPAIKYHREKDESRLTALIGGLILGVVWIIWTACRRKG